MMWRICGGLPRIRTAFQRCMARSGTGDRRALHSCASPRLLHGASFGRQADASHGKVEARVSFNNKSSLYPRAAFLHSRGTSATGGASWFSSSAARLSTGKATGQQEAAGRPVSGASQRLSVDQSYLPGGTGPLGKGGEGRAVAEGTAAEPAGLGGALAQAFKGVFFQDKPAPVVQPRTSPLDTAASPAGAQVPQEDGEQAKKKTDSGGLLALPQEDGEQAKKKTDSGGLLALLRSGRLDAIGSKAADEKEGKDGEQGTREADDRDQRTLEAREGATLRRMAEFAWPERHRIAVAVSTLGVTTGISLVFPWALGKILDVALQPDPAFTPGTIAAGMLGLFGLQVGLIVVRSAMLSVAGERIAAKVRTDTFSALVRQEVGYFDARRTGDLMNRLSSDTVVVQKALTSNVAQLLRNGFMSVGAAGMLFSLSPQLAALSLCLIPPVALGGIGFGRYVRKQQGRVQEELGRTLEVAGELLSHLRTVRQFSQEQREIGRFGAAVERAFEQGRRVGVAQALFDGAVHLAVDLSLLAVLFYGGSLVQDGAMSAGDLTAFLMYSLYAGGNLAGLSSVYAELMKGVGASRRIIEVADRKPELPLSGGVVLPSVAGEVELRNVRFAYPQRPDVMVLEGLDLHVPAGGSVSLVGGSGSGKSTVGQLLTGLYVPQEGQVLLDGHDISGLDPSWLRGTAIGVVQQEPVLFSGTIESNIRYGRPNATDAEVRRAAGEANAAEFIEGMPLGYDTPVGERGMQLSGGQRARVAIARLLLKAPPVAVLDEATAALDANAEKAVSEALIRAMEGRTVVQIAHRLSTIRHAQEAAVLEEGRVVQRGGVEELLAGKGDGAFRRLVQQQMVG